MKIFHIRQLSHMVSFSRKNEPDAISSPRINHREGTDIFVWKGVYFNFMACERNFAGVIPVSSLNSL